MRIFDKIKVFFNTYLYTSTYYNLLSQCIIKFEFQFLELMKFGVNDKMCNRANIVTRESLSQSKVFIIQRKVCLFIDVAIKNKT